MKLREKIIKTLVYWHKACGSPEVDQLETLFKEEMKRIIGEDEKPLVKSEYPKLGGLKIDFSQFKDAIARNQLRKEQQRRAGIR